MSIHTLFHWLPTALRIKTKILQDPDDLTHFSSRIPNPQHLSSSHTDVFFKCLRAFTTPKGTEALHTLLPLPALHSTHFPHLPLLSVPSDRNSVFTASGTVFHFPESLSSLTSPPSSLPPTTNFQGTCPALSQHLSQLSFIHLCDSIFPSTCKLHASWSYISFCSSHYSQCLSSWQERSSDICQMNKECKSRQFLFHKYLFNYISE